MPNTLHSFSGSRSFGDGIDEFGIFVAGEGHGAGLGEVAIPTDAKVVTIGVCVPDFKFGAAQVAGIEIGNRPVVGEGIAGIAFFAAFIGLGVGENQFDVGIGVLVEDGVRAEVTANDGDGNHGKLAATEALETTVGTFAAGAAATVIATFFAGTDGGTARARGGGAEATSAARMVLGPVEATAGILEAFFVGVAVQANGLAFGGAFVGAGAFATLAGGA